MQDRLSTRKYPFSLSMLGWALNEEESIAGYVDRAGRFLASLTDDYELVLVDDGSTDRTWEIMTDCARTRPWLRIVRNDGNRGPGYNTKRAIREASKDYLFWQTVDWAYDISELAENLDYLGEYDVLQGVRTNALDWRGVFSRRSDNPFKGLVSITNYLLVRVLFRLPMHDFQNVTVYPRELIQSCVLETESSFTNPECLLKTWWKGASFKEVPVRFLKRQQGKAKGTRPWQIYAAIRDILSWWSRWILLGRREDRFRGQVAYWTGRPTFVPTPAAPATAVPAAAVPAAAEQDSPTRKAA